MKYPSTKWSLQFVVFEEMVSVMVYQDDASLITYILTFPFGTGTHPKSWK
jgi:hypothetical protein